MATEELKTERRLKLCNNILFGFAKGMYDLFGESSLATVNDIGEDIIQDMEHEMGLEIHGEDPRAILVELGRLLIDEYGMCRNAGLKLDEHAVGVHIEGCMFWAATQNLRKADVPLYACVPMMIASAALRKRLGKRAHFVGVTVDETSQGCDIAFKLS